MIDLLGDLLEFLFVPSEERLTALTNMVSSKFDFVDSIKLGINAFIDVINNLGNVPKLNIELGATRYTEDTSLVVDFSWYAPFKNYGDLVITGFTYILFLWRLFTRLSGIISGAPSSEIINYFYSKRG